MSTGRSTRLLHDPSSYSLLWRHVIAVLLTDACFGDSTQKNEVRKWMNSPDREYVCDLAGVNDEWVNKILQALLSDENNEAAILLMRRTRFLLTNQDHVTSL